jgi:hypothetical protein
VEGRVTVATTSKRRRGLSHLVCVSAGGPFNLKIAQEDDTDEDDADKIYKPKATPPSSENESEDERNVIIVDAPGPGGNPSKGKGVRLHFLSILMQ